MDAKPAVWRRARMILVTASAETGLVDGWRRGVSGDGRTVEGKALADVPAVVFGQEVLEVVVGVFDGADFVDFVDEVASDGHGLVQNSVDSEGRGREWKTKAHPSSWRSVAKTGSAGRPDQ
jgi:hypothetical protein